VGVANVLRNYGMSIEPNSPSPNPLPPGEGKNYGNTFIVYIQDIPSAICIPLLFLPHRPHTGNSASMHVYYWRLFIISYI